MFVSRFGTIVIDSMIEYDRQGPSVMRYDVLKSYPVLALIPRFYPIGL